MLDTVCSSVLPCVILAFIAAAILKRINVFEAFLAGASKGLDAMLKTAPALIALTFTVKLLRCSGVLDMVTKICLPITDFLGVPAEIMPLALLRPISGSGSTALLTDIFSVFGPDSKIGLMASVLCCASETTFYTAAVYFGSCSVHKTRHTLFVALASDFASVVFSILFVNLLL